MRWLRRIVGFAFFVALAAVVRVVVYHYMGQAGLSW